MKTTVCKSSVVLFYSTMASASRSVELLWDDEDVADIECLEALLLAEERVSMACSIYTFCEEDTLYLFFET